MEWRGVTVEDRLYTECDEFRTCKAEGHGEWRVAAEMEERGAGKERGGGADQREGKCCLICTHSIVALKPTEKSKGLAWTVLSSIPKAPKCRGRKPL